MPHRCTVCDGEVTLGEERWANAWEKSRQVLACCSDGCAKEFHLDRHWLPSARPKAASEDESNRLYQVLRARLRDGDSPSVVTREMLQAGISPELIRGVLLDSQRAGAKSRKEAIELSILGVIRGIFTGTFAFFASRDKRSPITFEAAFADLEHCVRSDEGARSSSKN